MTIKKWQNWPADSENGGRSHLKWSYLLKDTVIIDNYATGHVSYFIYFHWLRREKCRKMSFLPLALSSSSLFHSFFHVTAERQGKQAGVAPAGSSGCVGRVGGGASSEVAGLAAWEPERTLSSRCLRARASAPCRVCPDLGLPEGIFRAMAWSRAVRC